MEEEFKIDLDVPIPVYKHNTRRVKIPWQTMPLNASVFVPGSTYKKVQCLGKYYERKFNRRFIYRTVLENDIKGVRVWRVE